MHALGIMVLFLVLWINGIWFVTCLHFVFDWLTKSDDSIFAEISFSHKIYCCSPPNLLETESQGQACHALLTTEFYQLTCPDTMDGGLTICCPLTEKLDYIGASYITAPVSPSDGITHVYSPIQTRLKTCFFLEYPDVTQIFSPSPRKTSPSLFSMLVEFV